MAIWERVGQKGRFLQASFSRPYQTQDGSLGASESFGLAQLADVTLAAAEAAVWIEQASKPRLRNGHDQERDDYGDSRDYRDAEM